MTVIPPIECPASTTGCPAGTTASRTWPRSRAVRSMVAVVGAAQADRPWPRWAHRTTRARARAGARCSRRLRRGGPGRPAVAPVVPQHHAGAVADGLALQLPLAQARGEPVAEHQGQRRVLRAVELDVQVDAVVGADGARPRRRGAGGAGGARGAGGGGAGPG